MSTARHIRHARRVTGWPLGHADPDEDDDEECPALDDFDEFFAATEPAALDEPCAHAADAAEDRWIAERDAVASQ